MEAPPGLSASGAALLALGSAVVLAVLHLLAPHIRRLPLVPEHVTASFAGGIATSYVFLHLLPELAEGNERVRELLAEEGVRSPLQGLAIFLVALAGFTVFYGLERLAERHKAPRGSGRGVDQARPHAAQGVADGAGVFRLHLASFLVYNAVIGYTLPLSWRASAAFAVLYTAAIGLHFVLSDRGLEEHYGPRFDRRGPRIALAAALLVGWAFAALLPQAGGAFVSLLTAFLAGSILLNVFKEEIPSTRQSHYGWFVAGLALYAVLLSGITAVESASEEGGRQAAATPAAVAG